MSRTIYEGPPLTYCESLFVKHASFMNRVLFYDSYLTRYEVECPIAALKEQGSCR